MKILVQNVLNAKVEIDKKIVGQIDRGFCIFVAFTNGDNEQIVDKMINKLITARLFQDENGKTNLSLIDIKGSILSISQFTLYASLKDGRRPSFIASLEPTKASELYDYFNTKIKELNINIEKGIFGADMKVSLTNDGPFTIMLDSAELIK